MTLEEKLVVKQQFPEWAYNVLKNRIIGRLKLYPNGMAAELIGFINDKPIEELEGMFEYENYDSNTLKYLFFDDDAVFPHYAFALAAATWAVWAILDEGFMRDIIRALQGVGDTILAGKSVDDIIEEHRLRTSDRIRIDGRRLYEKTGIKVETYRDVLKLVFQEPKLGEKVQSVIGNPYRDVKGWIAENWDRLNGLFELFYGERLDGLMQGKGKKYGLSHLFLMNALGAHPATIGKALRRTLEEYLDLRAVRGTPLSYIDVSTRDDVRRGRVLVGGIGKGYAEWDRATSYIVSSLIDLTKERVRELDYQVERGYIVLV